MYQKKYHHSLKNTMIYNTQQITFSKVISQKFQANRQGNVTRYEEYQSFKIYLEMTDTMELEDLDFKIVIVSLSIYSRM